MKIKSLLFGAAMVGFLGAGLGGAITGYVNRPQPSVQDAMYVQAATSIQHIQNVWRQSPDYIACQRQLNNPDMVELVGQWAQAGYDKAQAREAAIDSCMADTNARRHGEE